MNLKGWIERDGVRISSATTERKLIEETEAFSPCGGKFQFIRGDCIACNAQGIMPGQDLAGPDDSNTTENFFR